MLLSNLFLKLSPLSMALVGLLLVGCIPPTYEGRIDKRLANSTYEYLNAQAPKPVAIEVFITRRGKSVGAYQTNKIKNNIILYARASHGFSKINEQPTAETPLLSISIDIEARGSYFSRFVKEVFPLGFQRDFDYAVHAVYAPRSASVVRKSYSFVYTTTATGLLPSRDHQRLTIKDGEDKMIEMIVVYFLTDLKAEGILN